MGIDIGSNAGAQNAGGHVKIGADLELRVVKFAMEVGDGQFRRAPTAAPGDAFGLELRSVQPRELALPIERVGGEVRPPCPGFISPQRGFRRLEPGIEFDPSRTGAIDQFGFRGLAPKTAFSGERHGIGQRMDPMRSEERVGGVSPTRLHRTGGQDHFAIQQVGLLLDCGEMHGQQ